MFFFVFRFEFLIFLRIFGFLDLSFFVTFEKISRFESIPKIHKY